MQKLLKGEALVSRPNIKAEIRLFGMDESISMDEIREAVANEGKCKPEEVNVGKIGRTRTGAGVVWVRCPKVSAVTIADKQWIQIGWTSVRVELLRVRPIQCHKCWRIGHVREQCKSDKNYSGRCFKCGMTGHTAPKCQNKAKCILCIDMGMNGDHRMGSARCGVNMPRLLVAVQVIVRKPAARL